MKKTSNARSLFVLFFIFSAILCTIILGVSCNTYKAYATDTEYFVGYSGNSNIELATKNTVQNNNAPVITVFTHGLGGSANDWSNKGGEFKYINNSLIETLAKDRNKSIVYKATIKDINNFFLEELCVNDYDSKPIKTQLELTDINKHIFIVFEGTQSIEGTQNAEEQSNDDVYAELNYVIDKIIFDLQYLGVSNPRINLIGHGRGGILNMMYAIDHQYNVDGLFSLGTPYNGSTSSNLGKALFDAKGITSANYTNEAFKEYIEITKKIYSPGGQDAASTILADSYKSQWNNIIVDSNIQAHALGGVMGATAVDDILNFSLDILNTYDDMQYINNTSNLISFYDNNKPYVDTIINNMDKFLSILSVIDLINEASSIKEIVDIIYDEVTEESNGVYVYDPESNIVKFLGLGEDNVAQFISLKTELYEIKDAYDAGIALGKTEAHLEQEIAKGRFSIFSFAELFGNSNIVDSLSFKVFIQVTGIGDHLPNGITLVDLFSSDGIKYKNIFKDYLLPKDINMDAINKYLPIITEVFQKASYIRVGSAVIATLSNKVRLISATLLGLIIATEALDEYALNNYIESLIFPYTDMLNEFKFKSNTEYSESWYSFLEFWNDELVWMNDGFVGYNSQGADGYIGFTRNIKLFTEDNYNLYEMADVSLPIPLAHNLETRDSDLIIYIQQNINLGLVNPNIYNIRYTSLNEVEITGINNFYTPNTIINIPATINGGNVVGIASKAFKSSRYSNVIEFNLPNTIRYIGKDAFCNCISLASINLANTQISKIGEGAFDNCSVLNSINFPNTLITIGIEAFKNCSMMGIIYIPSNLTSIGDLAFIGCSNVGFNVSSNNSEYASINNSLYDHYLKSIIKYSGNSTLNSFSLPATVENIEKYAFAQDQNLNTIILTSVKKIGVGAFYNSNIANVNFANGASALLEEIGYKSFEGTPFLNNNTSDMLVLNNILIRYKGNSANITPAMFPANLTKISAGAFAGTDIQSVYLPEAVGCIYEYAFAECENLETLVYNSNDGGYIANYAFLHCSSLLSIDFRKQAVPLIGYGLFDECGSQFTIYFPYIARNTYINNWGFYLDQYNYDYLAANVSFDSQGGSDCSSIEVYYTGSYGILPETNRLGYDFIGWFDAATGGTQFFDNGGWFNPEDGTIYAHWNLHSYSITYYVDGQIDYNSNYILHFNMTQNPNLVDAVLDEWLQFIEWSTTSPTEYSPISVIPLGTTNDINLYGFYEYKQYSATFILDNGDSNIITNYCYGSELVFPFVEKTGHTLNGWHSNNGGQVIAYDSNSIICNFTGDAAIYADWLVEKYALRFNLGDNGNGTIVYQWLVCDNGILGLENQIEYIQYGTIIDFQSLTGLLRPQVFKYGYILNNISLSQYDPNVPSNGAPGPGQDAPFTVGDLGNDEAVVPIITDDYNIPTSNAAPTLQNSSAATTDFRIYYIWDEETYKVSLSADGTLHTVDITYGDLLYNNNYNKLGYTLIGWSINSTVPLVTYYNTIDAYDLTPEEGRNIEASDSFCLYAVYEIQSFIATYITRRINDPINNSNSYSSVTTLGYESWNYNSTIICTSVPSIAGYTFAWQNAPIIMPAHDITIYGCYTKIVLSVTFKNYDNTVYLTENIYYGAIPPVPSVTPTKLGCEFSTWSPVISAIYQNTVYIAQFNNPVNVVVSNGFSGTFVINQGNAVYVDCRAVNNSNLIVYKISSNVKIVTFKGNGNLIYYKCIIAEGNCNIILDSWRAFAPFDNTANIQTENTNGIYAGGNTVDLYCLGSNEICGGIRQYTDGNDIMRCNALYGNTFNITGNTGASLNLYGGYGAAAVDGSNGASGGNNANGQTGGTGVKGLSGGKGIIAVNISISKITLSSSGGFGGTGGTGGQGGTGGTTTNLPSSGKGYTGTIGGQGGTGGAGGQGGTAIILLGGKLTVCSTATVSLNGGYGGMGGIGGKGGTGGTGGTGADGRFLIFAGDGGTGGTGGRGGTGGAAGTGVAAIANLFGEIIGNQYITKTAGGIQGSGSGGDGGTGGTGGRGGKKYKSSNYADSGAKGSSGLTGSNG